MKKLMLLLALIMVFSSVSSEVYATQKSIGIKDEKVFKAIGQKYDFEYFNLEEKDLEKFKSNYENVDKNQLQGLNFNEEGLVEFDSLEELDEFLSKFNDYVEEDEVVDIQANENTESQIGLAAVDNQVLSWWGPIIWPGGSYAVWRYIGFNYEYTHVGGKPRFVKVYDITSWYSGLTAMWWDKASHGYTLQSNPNYNDTAILKASGAWVLGVKVNGFTIGYRISETWQRGLRLVP